jgi:hypothetical protein
MLSSEFTNRYRQFEFTSLTIQSFSFGTYRRNSRKSARVRAISDCAWTQITSLIPLGLVFRQLPSTTVPLVTRTLQSEQDQQFVPLRSAADTRTCAVGRLAGACHLSESRWGSIRAKELLFVQWILSSSAFYGSLAPDTLSVSRLAYSH